MDDFTGSSSTAGNHLEDAMKRAESARGPTVRDVHLVCKVMRTSAMERRSYFGNHKFGVCVRAFCEHDRCLTVFLDEEDGVSLMLRCMASRMYRYTKLGGYFTSALRTVVFKRPDTKPAIIREGGVALLHEMVAQQSACYDGNDYALEVLKLLVVCVSFMKQAPATATCMV